MPTKRTPLRRTMQRRITPQAAELFKAMHNLECTCPPRDWEGKYWEHEGCTGCDEWWRLNWELHGELNLMPHELPFRSPNERNPYPAGSFAAKHWAKEYDAEVVERERYWQLHEAAYGASGQRRARRKP